MTKTLQQLKDDWDFVAAPIGETCLEDGCEEPAIGIIETWNYGDEDDFPATVFYCEKHFLERYKDYD